MAKQELDDLKKKNIEQLKALETAEREKAVRQGIIDLTGKQLKQLEELSDAEKDIIDNLAQIEDALIKEQKTRKEIKDNIVQQESGLSSLGILQKNIVGLERARLAIQVQSKSIHTATQDKFNEIRTTISNIAELSSDDLASRIALQAKLDDQKKQFYTEDGKLRSDLTDDEKGVLSILQEQENSARRLSNLSSEQQDILKGQLEIYDSIRKGIKGVLATAQLLFSSPAGLFGGSLIGAGFLVDKLGDVNKQLGTSMFSMDAFTTSAAGLSFIFEDAVGQAKALTNTLGSTKDVSASLQTDANLLSSNLGLSSDQTATLIGQFGKLSGHSSEQALNMIKSTQATARMAGVIPNDVMKDLADNSEYVAKFTKGTGENIRNAAIQARQLGVTLATTGKISSTLLDFESSIAAELEASAMLGRDINFQKARGLFYAGKETEAMDEVLNQLGGIDAYNKMDIFDRQKIADTIGIGVDELQKIMANQNNINDVSSQVAEKYSKISEWSNYIANEWGGGILKGVGGAVITLGQFGTGAKTAADTLKGMKDTALGLPDVFSKIKGFFNKAPIPASTPTTKIPTDGDTGGKGSDGAGKMGNMLKSFPSAGQLAATALVLVAFAGAMWILSQAFKEFDQLQNVWQTLGVFGAAVLGMAVTLAAASTLLSAAYPQLLALAVVMVAIGAAVTLVGLGIKLATEGIASLVNAFGQLDASAAGNMLAFAASLAILTASVTALAAAGIIAMPVLAGLTVVGGVAAKLGLLGESKSEEGKSEKAEETFKPVIDAINGLRNDLMTKQLVVVLDGNKIYKNTALQNRTDAVTKYA